MKRIMTTLATAVAFASMSLTAQAEIVRPTTKPVVTTHTTTTKTVVTHHKVKGKKVHTAKHTKKAHHKVAHKGKKVAHSKEVNMDIPADIKINQSNSIVGGATAPVMPAPQATAPAVIVAPAVVPVVVTQ